MTTPPNILDAVTQAAWDAWCDARINSHLEVYTEVMAEEVGTTTEQQARTIFEVLEVMQVLAAGNDFICGRIDQITREFRYQNGIEHKQVSRMIERTIATEERSSKVSEVVSVIDEILAH